MKNLLPIILIFFSSLSSAQKHDYVSYDRTAFRLMIHALDGKQLKSVDWPIGQTDMSIDLSDLGSGMYIYYLQDKTGRVYGKNKLIKL